MPPRVTVHPSKLAGAGILVQHQSSLPQEVFHWHFSKFARCSPKDSQEKALPTAQQHRAQEFLLYHGFGAVTPWGPGRGVNLESECKAPPCTIYHPGVALSARLQLPRAVSSATPELAVVPASQREINFYVHLYILDD